MGNLDNFRFLYHKTQMGGCGSKDGVSDPKKGKVSYP